ncbi:hypothetical protein [Plantactinospora sonchi]|uniref:Integral membrane protein n=1 Tax=Plantactinospora sonchi TaxID=1544735 RepID=A0ABU7RKM9_9ACTN
MTTNGGEARRPQRRHPPVRPSRAEPEAPDWIVWPVRVLAAIVVVPARLLWELIVVAGRLTYRFLLRPLGWFVRHVLWIPLCWLAHHLVVLPFRYLVVFPVSWLVHHLLVVPARWLWQALPTLGHFLHRYLLRPLGQLGYLLLWLPLAWLVTYLVVVPIHWLVRYLLVLPIRWLVDVLRPLGRLLGRAAAALWHGTVRLFAGIGNGIVTIGRLTYTYLLRPFGLAARWLWRHTVVLLFRGVVAVCRATVVPVGRWLRDAVLAPTGRFLRDGVFRPAGTTVRAVLAVLSLRRP